MKIIMGPTFFWGKRVISYDHLFIFTGVNFFVFLSAIFFDIGSTNIGHAFSKNISYIIPSVEGAARLTANFNSSFFVISLAWFFSALFSIYIAIDLIKNKVFVKLDHIKHRAIMLPGMFLFLVGVMWVFVFSVPYHAGNRSFMTLFYFGLKDAKYSVIFYAEFIFFTITMLNMCWVMLIGGIVSRLLKFEIKETK